jgi:Cu/Ag efflux pump CusA
MLTMQLLNVRYQRDFRDNVTQLQRVLISTPSGAQIPVEHFRD